MYCRGQEHLRALHQKSKDSVLWAHCEARHGAEMVPFQMMATGYFREPLTRQIDEAVRIHHTLDTMNRRGEWRKAAVPRATYSRD